VSARLPYVTRRARVAQFRLLSMPAGLRRHLVGKTLRNVCHCDIALLAVKYHTDIFVNQRIKFYLNNAINLCPLLRTLCHVIPTNGDRVVVIDIVTSLYPVCRGLVT